MPLLPPSDYRPERAAALRAALLAAVVALGATGAAAEPQCLGGVPQAPEVSPISIAWVPTTEEIEAARESARLQARQRRPLPEKEGFIVYEVRIDDTLWGGGELFYGKDTPWVPLWNANKDVAPDPDHVPMGT